MVPVSSLAALAQRACEDHGCEQVIALLDARMNEIYTGTYRAGANGLVAELGVEHLLPPESIVVPAGAWSGAGPGWSAYPALAARFPALAPILPQVRPDAAAVVRLAAVAFAEHGGVDAAEAMPIYLRDTVAWQKTS